MHRKKKGAEEKLVKTVGHFVAHFQISAGSLIGYLILIASSENDNAKWATCCLDYSLLRFSFFGA
jgi:hypothetical protein